MAQSLMRHPCDIILIGGSAGSLQVVEYILERLSALTVPMLVVIHRANTPDSILAELLAGRTSFPVKEAEEKEVLLPGRIYLAPRDYHLLIEKDGSLSLDLSDKVNYSRPSIDVTFESAALAYQQAVVAILLSGANHDGVEGLKHIRDVGGVCLVQDPRSAEVDTMPLMAVEQVAEAIVLTPQQISEHINIL